MNSSYPMLWLSALLLIAGCAPEAPPDPPSAESFYPNLAAGERGTVEVQMVREAASASGAVLRARGLPGRSGGAWTTVESADDLLVNWADFPSAAVGGDGAVWVHWLEKLEGEGFAYGVRLARYEKGAGWSKPVVPHSDRSAVEHGFVSMVPWGEGIGLIWLDGREMAGAEHGDGHGHGPGATRLYFNTVAPDGSTGTEILLDPRVCDCCQTDLAVTGDLLYAAYRDRDQGEIRDISLVRLAGGAWSDPVTVHRDGWRIEGCPVNGPAIGARDRDVLVVWVTGAGGSLRVLAAWSHDEGRSFENPVQIHEGEAVGRVDLSWTDSGPAAVSWMEIRGAKAVVRVRGIERNGGLLPAVDVAETSAGRVSGFPRLAREGEKLRVAFTHVEGERREARTAWTEWPGGTAQGSP